MKVDINKLDFDKNSDGLIPVIVQNNYTLEVLMLGYMNREALELSCKEGKVTFYSRTKERLWTKGESSGNFLMIKSMQMDCDQDTILIRAEPIGPTCHTGNSSCFSSEVATTEGFFGHLQHVIQRRHAEMPEGSYTTKLFNKGVNKIAQKVGEEAVESVIEAVALNNDGLIYEASDLMYHLIVLLEARGLSLGDLEAELAKRHK